MARQFCKKADFQYCLHKTEGDGFSSRKGPKHTIPENLYLCDPKEWLTIVRFIVTLSLCNNFYFGMN